ncbi:MAG TPA: hypothetical protein VFP32_03970 [Candidatus Saccharimonadales bacterium]|nr:hypothetical protein [Candidatus Saccharimonadales bacterium]
MSVFALLASAGAYWLARACGNRQDLDGLRWAVILFGGASIGLGYQLGILRPQDFLLLGAATCWWLAATRFGDDKESSFVFVVATMGILALWSWQYDMSRDEYLVSFGLSVVVPLLLLGNLYLRNPRRSDGLPEGSRAIHF